MVHCLKCGKELVEAAECPVKAELDSWKFIVSTFIFSTSLFIFVHIAIEYKDILMSWFK